MRAPIPISAHQEECLCINCMSLRLPGYRIPTDEIWEKIATALWNYHDRFGKFPPVSLADDIAQQIIAKDQGL